LASKKANVFHLSTLFECVLLWKNICKTDVPICGDKIFAGTKQQRMPVISKALIAFFNFKSQGTREVSQG